MHWPDNSNPDNCAWLLNMFSWAAAQPRVASYMQRALPVLQRLEAQLEQAASCCFFGGDVPGVGDIGLFATIECIVTISPDALELKEHPLPRLRAWFEAMASLPGMVEYRAARPQAGARTYGNPGSLMREGRGPQ